MSQILKILFQTRDINIFVLRGVFFRRYVQLESSTKIEGSIIIQGLFYLPGRFSRALLLLYTFASFYHFVSRQFGILTKPQFHATLSDGSAGSKF